MWNKAEAEEKGKKEEKKLKMVWNMDKSGYNNEKEKEEEHRRGIRIYKRKNEKQRTKSPFWNMYIYVYFDFSTGW